MGNFCPTGTSETKLKESYSEEDVQKGDQEESNKNDKEPLAETPADGEEKGETKVEDEAEQSQQDDA